MKLDELLFLNELTKEDVPTISNHIIQSVKEVFWVDEKCILVHTVSNGYERKRLLREGGEELYSCKNCNELLPKTFFKCKKGYPEGMCTQCKRKTSLKPRLKSHNRRADGFGIIKACELEELERRTDKCPYCRREFGEDLSKVQLDHFIPLSKGGLNVISNLLICCKYCNQAKQDEDFFEWSKDYFSHNSLLTPYQVQRYVVGYFMNNYKIDYSDRINVPAD